MATYQITKNVADRYMGFADRNEIINTGYSKLWRDRYVKSTINILSVVMTGGIDPLFGFLDPQIFDGDSKTGLYQPHHIGDTETHLVTAGRIIMLDKNLHTNTFAYLAKSAQGVRLQELIMEGIYKLMDKNGDVTTADIVKVFGNLQIFGQKVSDWWFSQPDFANKLKTWNKGREFIRKGDIEGFLHFMFDYQKGGKTVNPLVDRFFRHAQKTIGSFMTLENFKDFSYLFTQRDMEFIKKYFFI